MMRKCISKCISVLICIALLLAVCPVMASAESAGGTYVALGDSITAGYGLRNTGIAGFLPQNNYHNFPENSYPALVGEALGADKVYNVGIEAAWATDMASFLRDPEYASTSLIGILQQLHLNAGGPIEIATKDNGYGLTGAYKAFADMMWMMGMSVDITHLVEDVDASKYHSLLLSTLKGAKTVSIELGGNDLLQGILNYGLIGLANDENGNVRNVAAKCLSDIVMQFMTNDFRITPELLESSRQIVMSQIRNFKLQDLKEILNFFAEDNLYEMAKGYINDVAKSYDDIIVLLKDGAEISKEEYDYLTACYAALDERMKTASKVSSGDEISPYDMLKNGRLTLRENDGRYFIDPIAPDADVIVIGTYNGYGDRYILNTFDYQQLLEFFMKAAGIFGEAAMSSMNAAVGKMDFSGLYAGTFGNAYRMQLEGLIDRIKQQQEKTANWFADFNLMNELGTLLGALPYSMLYLTVGRKLETEYYYFNEQVEAVADKHGLKFVDLIDMPSDGDIDVHPSADGHAYIANRIVNTIRGIKGVAQIGNLEYATLAEAVAAVKNEETIRLLADCNEVVKVDRSLTFYFNTSNKHFTGSIDPAEGYKSVGAVTRYHFVNDTVEKAATLGRGQRFLHLAGKKVGTYQFDAFGFGWTLKNENGLYLSVKNGALVTGRTPTAWTYKNGTFSCVETTYVNKKVKILFITCYVKTPVYTTYYLTRDGVSTRAGDKATFTATEAMLYYGMY